LFCMLCLVLHQAHCCNNYGAWQNFSCCFFSQGRFTLKGFWCCTLKSWKCISYFVGRLRKEPISMLCVYIDVQGHFWLSWLVLRLKLFVDWKKESISLWCNTDASWASTCTWYVCTNTVKITYAVGHLLPF
jgi:hypothetical protein